MTLCLRASKYDIKKSNLRHENFYLLRKSFLKYVDFTDELVESSYRMLDDAVVLPLNKRDSKGRTIIITTFAKRDVKKYSSADMYRLLSCIGTVLNEEEESQLAGFVQIFDGTGLEFRHVPSIADLQFLSQISQNASMIRVKKVILFNIPSFAAATIRLARSMLSKKIASRFVVIDKVEDFSEHLRPQSILPDNLGGDQPLSDVVDAAKKLMNREKSRKLIRHIRDVEVEWENVPRKSWLRWLSSFGQFRDLS